MSRDSLHLLMSDQISRAQVSLLPSKFVCPA